MPDGLRLGPGGSNLDNDKKKNNDENNDNNNSRNIEENNDKNKAGIMTGVLEP